MPKLPGSLFQELQNALLNAFPRYSQLEQMVRHQLDENLEKIVGKGNLEHCAFELIKWAEANGRLDDLIKGAQEANPGNFDLKLFIQHYGEYRAGRSSESSAYEVSKRKTGNIALQPSEIRKLRVFLCYASEDKLIVHELYRQLCADGADAWFDEKKLIPGDDWQLKTSRDLRSSDIVLVCLSKEGVNKEGYFQRELKIALDVADEKPVGTVFLIPVKLEQCDVPERLRGKHWADLNFDGESFNPAQYDYLMHSLVERAKQVGAVFEPTKRYIEPDETLFRTDQEHREHLEFPSEFLLLEQEHRTAIVFCSLIRLINSIVLQHFLPECDEGVYKSWESDKYDALLELWQDKSFLIWNQLDRRFVLEPNIQNLIHRYIDNNLRKKGHIAALRTYQRLREEKKLGQEKLLTIEELFHYACLQQMNEMIDVSLSTVLDECLDQYPTIIKNDINAWRYELEQLKETLESDEQFGELVDGKTIQQLLKNIKSKMIDLDNRIQLGE